MVEEVEEEKRDEFPSWSKVNTWSRERSSFSSCSWLTGLHPETSWSLNWSVRREKSELLRLHSAEDTSLDVTLLGNCTIWSRVDESEQSSRRRPLGLSRDPVSAPPPRLVRREGEVREED